MKTKFEILWFVAIAGCLTLIALVYSMNTIEAPTIATQPEEEPVYTDTADLDGDGEAETLKLFIDHDTIEGTETKLMIDDKITVAWGQNPRERLYIADIDSTDNLKEVAVTYEGPSSDYTTTFYTLINGDIANLGTIPGAFDRMSIASGELTNIINTQARGSILHTWFYGVNYTINEDNELKRIPQDFYDMNAEVNVLTSLDLVTSPEDDTIKTTLEEGDHVMIAGCDDVEWCRVDSIDGSESYGWFAVENFSQIKGTELDAFQVFDGLSNAD